MKQFIILQADENQRFDKYLKRILPSASKGFIYKMLRKKNITLNHKKAMGNEILNKQDVIEIFFSEDTFQTLSANPLSENEYTYYQTLHYPGLDIIYEDDDILIVNKPAGILSQKDYKNQLSINDYILAYLIQEHKISETRFMQFHPSISNRLDQNTSGLLLAGKTLHGQQTLADQLKQRSVHKYYRCIVHGIITSDSQLEGYLYKNEKNNKVQIFKQKNDALKLNIDEKKLSYIVTRFHPLASVHQTTYLQVELITGKTHQIRAHLSSIAHPILGDIKYNSQKKDLALHLLTPPTRQLLHAYCMQFASDIYIAPLPNDFQIILNELGYDEKEDQYANMEF